jgi:hypothetical protein
MDMPGLEKVVLIGSLSVPVLVALVILATKMREPNDASVWWLAARRVPEPSLH